MLPAQLTFAASLTCAASLTNPRCERNLRCKPLACYPAYFAKVLCCTPNSNHAQMKDMPLDLSQGVSQVQRQKHPHVMHSTCTLAPVDAGAARRPCIPAS